MSKSIRDFPKEAQDTVNQIIANALKRKSAKEATTKGA